MAWDKVIEALLRTKRFDGTVRLLVVLLALAAIVAASGLLFIGLSRL